MGQRAIITFWQRTQRRYASLHDPGIQKIIHASLFYGNWLILLFLWDIAHYFDLYQKIGGFLRWGISCILTLPPQLYSSQITSISCAVFSLPRPFTYNLLWKQYLPRVPTKSPDQDLLNVTYVTNWVSSLHVIIHFC